MNRSNLSRLGLVVAALLWPVVLVGATAKATTKPAPRPISFAAASGGGNVLTPLIAFTPEQFGAVGDGSHNDATAIQSAITAAEAAGGGSVELQSKTYNLGATQLTFDGAAPLMIRGRASSGYDHGAILKYSGSDWALKSTRNSYPANNGLGSYLGLENLTIEETGSSYLGAVYGNYLPVIMRGTVNLEGDPAQSPRIGTGWYEAPSLNQLDSSFETLWVGNFLNGVTWQSDSLHGRQFIGSENWNEDITMGVNNPMVDDVIQSMLLLGDFNAGHAALVLQEPSNMQISDIDIQGAGYGKLVAFAPFAEGTRNIPRITKLTGDGLAAGFVFMSGEQAPLIDHIDSFNVNNTPFDPPGLGVSTPSLPAGTGSGNAVQNTDGTAICIYQTGMSGTHVIDWLGTDKLLSSDPLYFCLQNGDKVYYATTKPSAWTWERPN